MADLVTKLKLDTGQFEGGLSKATKSIRQLSQEAELASKGLSSLFNDSNLQSAAQKFDGLNSVLERFKSQMSQSGTTTKQQLKSMTQAAQDLTSIYRGLSAEEKATAEGRALEQHINSIINKAGELRDTYSDVANAIKNTANDTMVFSGITQGVQALTATLQVGAGVATAFGVSQEKVAAVQQKLTSLIAITNGLSQIQNALQKDSALMTLVRTVREQGLAAALGLKTAATAADTAATTANTVATEANSAALKRNPIGLIATLAAAAVVGIIELTDAFNENTSAVDANSKAQEAFSNEVKNQSSTIANNLILINNMRNDMIAAGNSAEQQRKVFEKYRKKQVEVGLATKNAGQMHVAVVKNTNVIIEAANLRMKAAAAEAAVQAELGKVIQKVAELREKAAKGENFEWEDFTALGVNARKLYDQGLLKPSWKAAILNADSYYIPEDKINEVFDKIYEQAIDHAMNNQIQSLQKLRDAANAQLSKLKFDTPEIKWDEGDETDRATSSTQAHTRATRSNTRARTDQNRAQQQGVNGSQEEKTQLEKLDELYAKLTKKIGTLGKETEKNKTQFEELRKQIQAVLANKISIMPVNTVGDIDQVIKTLQTLLEWLDKDSKEYETFSKLLTATRIDQANMKLSLIDTKTLEGAQAAEQVIQNVVRMLPEGSEELTIWAAKLKEATQHAKEMKNAVEGIQEGSIADLRQQIQVIDQRLANENLEMPFRATLELQRDELQQKINDLTTDVIVEVQKPIDFSYDYKLSDLEKLQRDFDRVAERKEYLTDLKESGRLASWDLEAVNKELDELNERYKTLNLTVHKATINEDIKELKKELTSLRENMASGFLEGIDSFYQSVTSLKDVIEDDDKNPFEKIMAGLKAIEGGYKTVKGLIDTFNEMKNTIETLTKAQSALNTLGGVGDAATATEAAMATTQQVAATSALATAQTAAATASQVLSAAQVEMATLSLTTIAGVKALAAAYTQLAAAEYMAAHASIPFAGFAIGSAFATAAKVLIETMGAFANGGIVGGSSYTGDNVLARLNSGEMVLNRHQQRNLFGLINSGTGGSSQVEFKIKGKELVGVINNYNDKFNKVK